MDDSGNVVEFKKGAPSARLKSLAVDDKRRGCPHRSIEVWPKEPIIECATCGTVVDPYWWLRERCADWREMVQSVEWRRDEAKRELDELRAQLRVLERQLMIMPPRKR